MSKVVIILSGGMDSTVLLYHHLALGETVRCLGFNYGQRHIKELAHAEKIADEKGVSFKVVDLKCLRDLLPGSSQTDDRIKVPEGHYAEDTMKLTVVPNRNMIMMSIAIGHCIAMDFDGVSYGAHSGDHTCYPDCRPEFVAGMAALAKICDWKKVDIFRPFMKITKAEIVRRGAALRVPFEKTWSCYKGLDLHCGRCGTCVERREAFFLAKVEDPTTYLLSAPSVEEMVEMGWKI